MSVPAGWIPADAGMTDEARWVCPNSIGDGYSITVGVFRVASLKA